MKGRRWVVVLLALFGAVLACVVFLPDPATTAQNEMRDALLEAGFEAEALPGTLSQEADWVGSYKKEGMTMEDANRLAETMRRGCSVNWMLVKSTDRAVLGKEGGYIVLPKVESLLQLHGRWGEVTTKLTWSQLNADTTTCSAAVFRNVDPVALVLASVGL